MVVVAEAVVPVLCFGAGLVLEWLERCGIKEKKIKEKRNDW